MDSEGQELALTVAMKSAATLCHHCLMSDVHK